MSDADDLLSDLARAARSSKNQYDVTVCQVCTALEAMPPEVAEVVRMSIDGRTIGQDRLAQILTDHGYPTGRRHMIRHQKGHTS